MFAWLNRYRGRVGMLALCAFLPMLMAPSGGIPSRPRFQAVGVNAAAPAAGNITASGTVTAANIVGTTGTIGGSAICRADGTNCPAGTTQTQGNLTIGSYSGFSSNPFLFGTWTRTGNLVCLNIGSSGNGTSNSGAFGFTISGMPSMNTTVGGTVRVRNNGNWMGGNYRIETTGAVQVAEDSASSNNGFNANFTASGAKDLALLAVCYRTP